MKLPLLVISLYFQISLIAQNGTDIILFDITIKPTGITLSKPVSITNHKGYDNQPFFYKRDIYYSSEDSAQMDIKKYDYFKKTTSAITHSEENEFSPMITPDGKFFSCILQRKNGNQDLVKYPLAGGKPITIIDNLKVGYHAWINNTSLLLFVLEDTSTFTLHYYNTKTKEDRTVATNIGRGVNKIPGKAAVSFIQKTSSDWLIKRYDEATKKVSNLMTALPNRDLLTWTQNGLIIMSDGKDIYYAKPGKSNWQKIELKNHLPLKNITRLALNDQNTKLAVVVSE